ncbi:hypothetical protein [Pseudoalteromonas luteoviolacea]|nr:hypothetical protein [Pseudoalteromonas luteoviolacea]
MSKATFTTYANLNMNMIKSWMSKQTSEQMDMGNPQSIAAAGGTSYSDTNKNGPSTDATKQDEPPKDHNITIVAHLDNEDDWIGHAFVIMRNAKGEEIAKGYWPKDSADAKDFILGTDIDGAVYDEKGDYYERFNEWLKTGKDPGKPNGQFAYKSFAITRQQYGDAMKAMKDWSANPYSSSRMCGTFATHVLSASGNKVWDRWLDPHPTRLFEQFGGKFE